MCPDYPVLSYTVVLEDADGAQRAMVTGNSTNIRVDGLAEDMGYAYHIRAANQLGNSDDSSPVGFCKCDTVDPHISEPQLSNYLPDYPNSLLNEIHRIITAL